MSLALMMAAFKGSSGLSVNATANGDSNYVLDGTCYVGVEFQNDGDEWELAAATGSPSVDMGSWLTSGSASDVWVEFIRTGGSASQWVGLSNSTRYNLGTTRKFYITRTKPVVPLASATITGYFRFWDAATGGSTLQTTSTVTWTATSENSGGGGGPCSLC